MFYGLFQYTTYTTKELREYVNSFITLFQTHKISKIYGTEYITFQIILLFTT
ncbi:MAG: hypothetical protein ACO2PO_17195 [Candidatus Calescibacterium sp.]